MVLLEVADFRWRLVCARHQTLEEPLVVLRPLSNGQLGNEQSGVAGSLDLSSDDIAALAFASLGGDLAGVAAEMRVHHLWLISLDHLAEIRDDIAGVVVLNGRAPTRTDSVAPVH